MTTQRPARLVAALTTLLSVGLVSVGIVAISRAQSTPRGNLIRNGDFEDGPGLYAGLGKSWEPADGQPHPTINVLSPETRQGTGFCQLLKANPQLDTGAARQLSDYGSVTAGKTYRIQAWIKTARVTNPEGWYVFGIEWFQGETCLGLSKMPQPETSNYDWRSITWTAIAPAGADRVAALLTRHTDGDVWYDDISIAEEIAGQPVIAFEPQAISHRIRAGSTIPDDLLCIRNDGGSTLNYTLKTNAQWLSIKPATGTSMGETDNCTLTYSVTHLPIGQHRAAITIAAPDAANSPQTIPVTITVTPSGGV